jgi:hypothetical protein
MRVTAVLTLIVQCVILVAQVAYVLRLRALGRNLRALGTAADQQARTLHTSSVDLWNAISALNFRIDTSRDVTHREARQQHDALLSRVDALGLGAFSPTERELLWIIVTLAEINETNRLTSLNISTGERERLARKADGSPVQPGEWVRLQRLRQILLSHNYVRPEDLTPEQPPRGIRLRENIERLMDQMEQGRSEHVPSSDQHRQPAE